MNSKVRLGALFAPLSLVLGQAVLGGCASSEASRPAAAAPDQAAAFAQNRCTGFTEDGAVADIINGKAVERVSPLYSGGGSSKTSNPRLIGAAVYVRPAGGETAEWLNRALECHSAKRTSDRAAAFAAGSDPFFLPDSVVRIRVQAAGDSLKVSIEGASSSEAHEILARATSFASASGASVGYASSPELP
jgi:hypothetical protein